MTENGMSRNHALGLLLVFAKPVRLTEEFERGAITPVAYPRSHFINKININNNYKNKILRIEIYQSEGRSSYIGVSVTRSSIAEAISLQNKWL